MIVETEIYAIDFEGHPLRFLKGPRFEGDLPWWIAEDIADCIAQLLDRPDLSGELLRAMHADGPDEDQAILRIQAAEPGARTELTAVSEYQLRPMMLGLIESRHHRLVALARWFEDAASEAATWIGADPDVVLARRGDPQDLS